MSIASQYVRGRKIEYPTVGSGAAVNYIANEVVSPTLDAFPTTTQASQVKVASITTGVSTSQA